MNKTDTITKRHGGPRARFVPFTKEDYPRGYYRADAVARLTSLAHELAGFERAVQRARREIAELRLAIKRGGTEEPL